MHGTPRPQRKAPPFVFCASLADVFDNAVPEEWRRIYSTLSALRRTLSGCC
nr:hypothetical protein [Agrobacterium tumefaciens]